MSDTSTNILHKDLSEKINSATDTWRQDAGLIANTRPLHLMYAENLLHKAEQISHKKNVQQLLFNKAEQALKPLENITTDSTDNNNEAQHALSPQSALKALHGLLDNCQQQRSNKTNHNKLQSRLLQDEKQITEFIPKQSNLFADASEDSEHADEPQQTPSYSSATEKINSLDIQAIEQLKTAWAEQQLDALIQAAIDQTPESPGPLNPQMLAIKSLEEAKRLSPSYAKRLASYLDTLFYLEKSQ